MLSQSPGHSAFVIWDTKRPSFRVQLSEHVVPARAPAWPSSPWFPPLESEPVQISTVFRNPRHDSYVCSPPWPLILWSPTWTEWKPPLWSGWSQLLRSLTLYPTPSCHFLSPSQPWQQNHWDFILCHPQLTWQCTVLPDPFGAQENSSSMGWGTVPGFYAPGPSAGKPLRRLSFYCFQAQSSYGSSPCLEGSVIPSSWQLLWGDDLWETWMRLNRWGALQTWPK